MAKQFKLSKEEWDEMWSLESAIKFAKEKGMPPESYENAKDILEIYEYWWYKWRPMELKRKKEKGEKK